ncbi:protein NRT1/ PTR FAMILY 1.2-like [Silene latifolia]|uniref:protein NRT1/ PTR FAMILY 1.2-like n=1 Tax=Silene latifolia TaxID=37657 RepID=UPI003D773056
MEDKLMEVSEDETMLNQNIQDEEHGTSKSGKGGFITMPFILANEAFERVASFGLTPNMIVYLTDEYKLSVTKAQNLLYLYNSANNFTPFVGAILADSFLGRFLAISIGSVFSLLGMLVIWMTTFFPNAKPPPCDTLTTNCQSPTTGQYAFLVFGFILLSIGAGGTRPCSQVFGADQLNTRKNANNNNSMEIFLNWYYMCSSVSIIIALTVIVYIQEHLGWMIGFGVPVVLMFLATLFFLLASPFYVKVKGNTNLLTGLVQVIVAAFLNRKMNLSDPDLSSQYYHERDSTITVPSDELRFLNKSCIVQDTEKDIRPDGLARNPWRLCRVEDVEGLKAFIRVIPIWSAGIMISVNTSGSPFGLLLTRTMDRHVGSKFEIPAASFGTFIIFVIGIWIPLYDRVLIPLASKIRGKPVTLSVKLRIGLGLFFSFLSILSSGIVESIRRQKAIDEGFEDDPLAVIHMSALWILPHSIFGGIAEAFFVIGQTEFFYTELPLNMLSIAGSIFGLGGTFGSLIASFILNSVDSLTKSEGNEGWMANNVNKGHYDYYYYLLASLNVLNLLYYVYCSSAYGPTKLERMAKEVIEKDTDEGSPLLRDSGNVSKTD